MARNWTIDDLKVISDMGAFHYSPQMMTDVLEDVTATQMEAILSDPDNIVTKWYRKGKEAADRLVAELPEDVITALECKRIGYSNCSSDS